MKKLKLFFHQIQKKFKEFKMGQQLLKAALLHFEAVKAKAEANLEVYLFSLNIFFLKN